MSDKADDPFFGIFVFVFFDFLFRCADTLDVFDHLLRALVGRRVLNSKDNILVVELVGCETVDVRMVLVL